MEDLTFGEQVKIILGRKGMTIKQLAELIEVRTGKKMSRQNLTQRLGRDNFQEQDMRMIAEILECPFRLSILGGESAARTAVKTESRHADAEIPSPSLEPRAELQDRQKKPQQEQPEQKAPENTAAETAGADERDMTIGELYDIHRELSEMEESIKAGEPAEKAKEEIEKKKGRFRPGGIFLRRKYTEEPEEIQETSLEETGGYDQETEREDAEREAADGVVQEQDMPAAASEEQSEDEFEPVIPRKDAEEDTVAGEINPYTGREYQSNSVRMHPTRIGYVQVYDRSIHKWTDTTEWAFLGYQERKKTLLGNAYEPPIYLD